MKNNSSGEGSIVKKAYELNLNKLDEGFLSDAIICHADTFNEAKSILLTKVKYDGWKLKYSGDELSYINIPVRRNVQSDIVIFEGQEVPRDKINGIINTRERMAKFIEILANPAIQYCYILKGNYYRPNSCGYTQFIHEAGVYTKEDAVQHAISCSELTLRPIDITEHNKMLTDKIQDFTSRLL